MKRRLPARWLLAAAVLLGLLLESPTVGAAAQRRWLKLDRVEAAPSWVKGMARVRAYVTAINVYGGMLPIGGVSWKLKVGNTPLRSHAYALPYSTQADQEVLLVGLVIQTSAETTLDQSQPHSLTEIKPAAIHFLEDLPKTARIALATYSDQVVGGKKLESLSTAVLTLRKLSPAKTPRAALTKAIRRVIRTLNHYKPMGPTKDLPVRKLIVVIGDGRDSRWPDPKGPTYVGAIEESKKLAKLADRHHIRIHTIGYSAENWRRPMLLLGDLSKRSHGTFRLGQSYDSYEVLLRSLQNEIRRQQVLTFYVPEKRIRGRKLRVAAGDLESNEIRVGKLRCGAQVCQSDEYCSTQCVPRRIHGGTGLATYALYIGGGLVGVVGLLFVVGFVITKLASRSAHAEHAVDMGAAPPEPDDDTNQAIQPQPNPYAQNAQPGAAGGAAAPSHQAIQPQANPYAQQQKQRPPRAARRSRAAAGTPTLLVIKGEQQGQQFELHHNFRIGKGPHCDLVLATDGYASTDHAYIQMDRGGNCTLVDNQSTNGTFINGVRIVNQRRLEHGMLVRVGATELRFLTQ